MTPHGLLARPTHKRRRPPARRSFRRSRILSAEQLEPRLALAVVQASFTADNHYALYYGDANGSALTFVGRNETGQAGSSGTYNWSQPESYAFDAPAGSHLFLVAWDSGLWQMIAGQFSVAGEETVGTNGSTWQCVVTGQNNPGDSGSLPGSSTLSAQIQSAAWQSPRAVAPQGTEPWGTIPGLSSAAEFIWPDTLEQASASDSGYVIFRTTRPAVPFPTASATITADNHYALFKGAPDGSSLSFIGCNEPGHSGDPGTWNWSLPETWGFRPDVGDHLYVVAWDDGGPQSWIGQFALPDGSTLVSNTQDWEYVLGDGSNPGPGGQAPSTDTLRSRISAAAWADIGAADANGASPWGTIPGITSAASFLWHDTLSDGSASDSTYAIYRTKMPVLACDLDVDSDNDNRLKLPDRSPEEDRLETSQAKRIVVNDNDTDADGVPDYADGYGLGGLDETSAGIIGKRFTPIVIQIPDGPSISTMQLTVTYSASDPQGVAWSPGFALPASPASLRLWAKNAYDLRDPRSVIDGGDFVPQAAFADLTQLGFSDAVRTKTFYVEGVRTTAGIPAPISIQITAGPRVMGTDLVNVLVVSNTLVIGIDGTDTRPWLEGVNGNRANGLWNSHVRNLVTDASPYAMTIYRYGPDWGMIGLDSRSIRNKVVSKANEIIEDAGGGTSIALVGWSRGAMIALWAANELSEAVGGPPPTVPRKVVFVGLYDPVDLSPMIPSDAGNIQPGIERVTIVGPRETPNNNVDYPVGLPSYWLGIVFTPDPVFVRMAQNDRITALGANTVVQRAYYNASHGAIGGAPGYSTHLVSIPDGFYDYAVDVERSILSDRDIRTGMREAGLDFVPDRDDEWYGFPATRPLVH